MLFVFMPCLGLLTHSLFISNIILLYALESLHHSCDVIALSETLLNCNNSHIFYLEVFHFICQK